MFLKRLSRWLPWKLQRSQHSVLSVLPFLNFGDMSFSISWFFKDNFWLSHGKNLVFGGKITLYLLSIYAKNLAGILNFAPGWRPVLSHQSLPYISRPHVDTLHQSAPSLPLVTSHFPSQSPHHCFPSSHTSVFAHHRSSSSLKGLCHYIGEPNSLTTLVSRTHPPQLNCWITCFCSLIVF